MGRESTPVQGNTVVRRTMFLALAGGLAALLTAGSPALVSATAGEAVSPGAGERALAAMEALREEIATLAALRDAQAALLAWNRENARGGAPLQSLPAALCREPAIEAWCGLLPATFGARSTEDRGAPWSRGTPQSRGTPRSRGTPWYGDG